MARLNLNVRRWRGMTGIGGHHRPYRWVPGPRGLHCERKDERCGVFGGARGGQYQHGTT